MKFLNSIAAAAALAAVIASYAGAEVKAGETLYGTVLKQVSVSGDLSHKDGRLLPTNAIEVLEVKDGVVKFSLTGYQNPKAPNVIYFTPKARIIAVAFSKQAKFQSESLGEEDGFNKVKITAYTDEGALSGDVDKIFAGAKEKFEASCSVCHALHQPADYEANRWPGYIKAMLSRTPISKDESWTVVQYLQKHSKDVNLKDMK